MARQDPHAATAAPTGRRDPRDEEHSRVTNPGKYAVLRARVDPPVTAIVAAGPP